MSKFKSLLKALGYAENHTDDAAKVLELVDNPELAVSLKGDPRKEYLSALESIYGDKEKRAAEMGFGKRKWYHGTTAPIDEFKKEALGLSTEANSAKKGFFFTDNPSVASDYSELAQKQGVRDINGEIKVVGAKDQLGRYTSDEIQKLNDEYRAARDAVSDKVSDATMVVMSTRRKFGENSKEYLGAVEELQKLKEPQNKLGKRISDLESSGGQNVLQVRLKGNKDNIHVKDYGGLEYRDNSYANEMDEAIKQGKSGVLMKNTHDYATLSNNPKLDIAAVFEPNQIRSTHAAFDPRFKKSGLIMAGAGAIPMAGKPDISPLPMLKEGLNKYTEYKDKALNYLTDQMNFGKDELTGKVIKGSLGLGADPLNYIPGIGGAAMGAAELFADDPETISKKNALKKLSGN